MWAQRDLVGTTRILLRDAEAWGRRRTHYLPCSRIFPLGAVCSLPSRPASKAVSLASKAVQPLLQSQCERLVLRPRSFRRRGPLSAKSRAGAGQLGMRPSQLPRHLSIRIKGAQGGTAPCQHSAPQLGRAEPDERSVSACVTDRRHRVEKRKSKAHRLMRPCARRSDTGRLQKSRFGSGLPTRPARRARASSRTRGYHGAPRDDCRQPRRRPQAAAPRHRVLAQGSRR